MYHLALLYESSRLALAAGVECDLRITQIETASSRLFAAKLILTEMIRAMRIFGLIFEQQFL